jgi:hypothetical protein
MATVVLGVVNDPLYLQEVERKVPTFTSLLDPRTRNRDGFEEADLGILDLGRRCLLDDQNGRCRYCSRIIVSA